MNDVSLNPEIVELEAEMEYEMPQYPVIPNPEGEPTEEITKMEIDDVIYEVADAEARATLPTKVDKEEGKGLSTNDYTDTDKAIVDGVTSALDGKVDKVAGKGLSTNDYDNTAKGIVDNVTTNLATKVDKVEGKGLSANDFTDTLKDKLDGIEAEANKTIVDNSVTATSTNPVESKAIYNLLNDLLPEAEETGNPITISNASGFNAKALTVDMLPIQDTSGGEPSPTNICPISGRTQTEIKRCGKNLFDKTRITTQNTTTIDYARTNGGLLLKGGTTYTLSIGKSISSMSIYGYGGEIEASNRLAYISSSSTLTFTLTDTTLVFIRLYNNNASGGISESDVNTIQIEVGSSATTYEPYAEVDTTISFGQTVYGGTCDVVGGGTSSKWKIINLKDLNWTKASGTTRVFRSGRISDIEEPVLQSDTPEAYCSCFKVDSYSEVINSHGICVIWSASTYHGQLWCDYDYNATLDEFKEVIKNQFFCYILATPTTINTPATSISLNKGNNALSTSGDNMELIYSKIPQ